MKKIIGKAFYSLLLFIIIVVCLLSFILTTTPGLYTAIRFSKLFLPGTLKVHHLTGRLMDKFSIEGLDYQNKNTQIKINLLKIHWNLLAWQGLHLNLNSLFADTITIKSDKTTHVLNDINITGDVNPRVLVLDSLRFKWLNQQISIQLQAGIPSPHALISTIRLCSKDKQSTLNANMRINGNLNQLLWTGAFHGPVEGSFKGNLRGDLHDGQLTITLNPGQYKLPDNKLSPSLEYKGGSMNAVLTPKGLSGTGLIAIDPDKQLTLTFNLPQLDLQKGISPNQPISGQLELAIKSLDFLQQISPELSKPRGHLSASLNAKGTLSKILFDSQLHLSQASLSLPILGLNLDSIDFKAIGSDKQWDANGFISSGNKKLFIKGTGPISNTFSADISIESMDFPLINTREYQVNVSPKLELKISPSILNITGSILVPMAHIKPQTFTNSLTLSDDVVFENRKESSPSLLNTSMNVSVEMGNEVQLSLKGLQAILEGKVTLQQQPKGPINATGELNISQGQYKAYGQNLPIQQAQLFFTGGRLDNPGINLRAAKKINNANTLSGNNSLLDFTSNNPQQVNYGNSITVGVEVTGRLSTPKIQLFSTPSTLSQADILSLLVLGRPASQATKAGGQLLLTAISSMNLGKGTNGAQLLEQLKQSSGIDFNVQTNTNYNQTTGQFSDSTAVVVGKSLSKRLYLSYNVGLSQSDPNVLTLKYMLNKLFSIQITSSTTGNGIDVLYSKDKKK